MSCSITILSTETAFHSPTVVVTTEYSRFLFDIGEGTQRLVAEHKVRLGKVHAVCTTSSQVHSVGGLTGMLLTLGDAGVGKLDVIGPQGVKTFLAATNNFTRPIENYFLPEVNPATGQLNSYVTKDLTLYPIALGLLERGIAHCQHFCYIAETPQIPGKFFLEKAVALGVPKGPSFGKLKNGQSVVLADGTVIEPSQVLGEPTYAQFFAIVARIDAESDLASLQSLVQNPVFAKFETSSTESQRFQVMVHLSARSTVETSLYQQWLSTFGNAVQHIFVGAQMTQPNSACAYLAERVYNRKLNRLFPETFPALWNPSASSSSSSVSLEKDQSISEERSSIVTNIIAGEPMLKYHILPLKRVGLDHSEVLVTTSNESSTTAASAMVQEEDFLATLDQDLVSRATLHKDAFPSLSTSATSSPSQQERLRFFFLGTGCAIPSKYRNVSSTLCYLPQRQAGLLLDCGEGTWYQLMRLRPPTLSSEAEDNDGEVRALHWAQCVKAVWISHLHADHHLGLIHLMLQRQQRLLQHNPQQVFEPLLVIAPMFVLKFLELVTAIMPSIKSAFLGVPSNLYDPTDMLCQPCRPSEDDLVRTLQRNTWPRYGSPLTSDSNDLTNNDSTTTAAIEVEDVVALVDSAISIRAVSEESEETNDKDDEDDVEAVSSAQYKKRKVQKDWRPRLILPVDEATLAAPNSGADTTVATSAGAALTVTTRSRAIAIALRQAQRVLREELGVVELVNVPVIHCMGANGLVITFATHSSYGGETEDSKRDVIPTAASSILSSASTSAATSSAEGQSLLKLVYSGDTRPSRTLVHWGRGADLLLHEATFEDDKVTEAVMKRHSTISEAVQVCRAMECRQVVLTHFSQRYHGIPTQFHPTYVAPESSQQLPVELAEDLSLTTESNTLIYHPDDLCHPENAKSTSNTDLADAKMDDEETDQRQPGVIVAFDFMTVSDLEWRWASGLTPLLAEIFPAVGDEEDEDNNLETEEAETEELVEDKSGKKKVGAKESGSAKTSTSGKKGDKKASSSQASGK